MTDAAIAQRINDLYAAFNRRDSAGATEGMTAGVTWPRAFKGGFVEGREAIRSYWAEQWTEIDPHVEPTSIRELDDGRVDVEVHQVVKDLGGAVVADAVVHHVYTFNGPLVSGMELGDAG